MFENVYVDSDAKSEENKAENLISMLYTKLVQEPERLPHEFYNMIEEEGIDRVVCDYIAGMSDRYAVNVFNLIYIPARWMKR